MSSADVVDGVIVLVLALGAAALELVGRNPSNIGGIFRIGAARRYVGVNLLAAAIAYAAVLALHVQFRKPDALWRILACGFTAMTVLRSGVMKQTGISGPAQALTKLREQYAKEMDEHAIEVERQRRVQHGIAVSAIVADLDWKRHKEALAVACMHFDGKYTEPEYRRVVAQIANTDATTFQAEMRMFTLAMWLQSRYGMAALRAAADKVRAFKEEARDEDRILPSQTETAASDPK